MWCLLPVAYCLLPIGCCVLPIICNFQVTAHDVNLNSACVIDKNNKLWISNIDLTKGKKDRYEKISIVFFEKNCLLTCDQIPPRSRQYRDHTCIKQRWKPFFFNRKTLDMNVVNLDRKEQNNIKKSPVLYNRRRSYHAPRGR